MIKFFGWIHQAKIKYFTIFDPQLDGSISNNILYKDFFYCSDSYKIRIQENLDCSEVQVTFLLQCAEKRYDYLIKNNSSMEYLKFIKQSSKDILNRYQLEHKFIDLCPVITTEFLAMTNQDGGLTDSRGLSVDEKSLKLKIRSHKKLNFIGVLSYLELTD